MTAYSTRMPAGIPGAMSRMESNTTEAMKFDPATPPATFGSPVILVSGKVQPVNTATVSAGVVGFTARPYPATGASGSSAIGSAIPAAWSAADIMKRGYMTVALAAGDYTSATIFKGNPVYVRTTAATTPTRPVGGLSDQATGTVAIPNCVFMGPPDGFGNVEIAFNI